MEALVAAVSGLCLGLFLVRMWVRWRDTGLYRVAGGLLTNDWGIRWSIIIVIIPFALWLVLWAALSEPRDWFRGWKTSDFFFTGAMLTFLWSLVRHSSAVGFMMPWIELREDGVVSGGGRDRDLIVVPWRRVRYCQWLDPGNKLSIYSFEPFRVARSKQQAVTDILLTRTEVRGPAGNVLNPEFVRPEPPRGDAERLGPRWFQFDVKTLVLLAVLAFSALAWWAIHSQPA
jgi:hypothetical protein